MTSTELRMSASVTLAIEYGHFTVADQQLDDPAAGSRALDKALESPARVGAVRNVVAVLTPACDTYSAAACLYFLLTDRLPIELPSDARAYAMLLTEKPKPIRECAAWIPHELAAAIDGTLGLGHTLRPSCEELRTQLMPFSRSNDRP